MTLGTDDDFQQSLSADLAWRRVELHSLRSLLESKHRASSSSPATRALARAFVTMIYAHWEGFGKHAFFQYASVVAKRKPSLRLANDALFVLHTEQLAKRILSGDPSAVNDFRGIVRENSDPRIRLDKNMLSDTRANLRSRVLFELLRSFGHPTAEFETSANLIDTLICDRRNTIAHGRGNFPDASEILELHLRTLELMERIETVLVNAVATRSYLRAE